MTTDAELSERLARDAHRLVDINDPLPPRRRFSSLWDFVVRAYRPAAAWVGVATMLVHGVLIPLLPVFGHAPVAIDWMGVSAFLGVIYGPLVVARTVEKLNGVTS